MEISPLTLIKLLLYSLIWGASVGALIDLNRAFRMFFDLQGQKSEKLFGEVANAKINLKPKVFIYRKQAENAIIFIQDFFVAVVYIFGLLIINFSLNQGSFRLFSIFTSILGIILFKISIGKIISEIFEWATRKAKLGIIIIFYLIYKPILYFLTKICEFCKKNYMFLKNSIANLLPAIIWLIHSITSS